MTIEALRRFILRFVCWNYIVTTAGVADRLIGRRIFKGLITDYGGALITVTRAIAPKFSGQGVLRNEDDSMRGISKIATGLIVCGLMSSVATATETITYTYDARGRLVKVVHTGTVNNNNQACYKYDKADNRTNVQATVASLPACP